MGRELPLISIITPSYNQGEFLEDTILSVLSQDYSDIEYILIDGGSTDNSLDIIRQYKDRISDWVSEKDMGQAHAINKGLLRSRGEFLGWLNSDDILLPSTVSRVIKVFDEYPDIDVVYGRLERINWRNKVVSTPLKEEWAEVLWEQIFVPKRLTGFGQIQGKDLSEVYLVNMEKTTDEVDGLVIEGIKTGALN
jgi:glycosyltransferase involved in cell wall biosynthesis